MADADNPKTHVENQNIDLPRKQPESPKHEGIDPLTESDTMYPREEVKSEADKLHRREYNAEPEPTEEEQAAEDTVADQEARAANPKNASEKRKADAKTAGGQEPKSPAGDKPQKDSPETSRDTSPSNKTESKRG